MHLAKVLGAVVATQKYETLKGVKLLLIQPVDHDRKPKGEPLVAVDPMQAGPGEIVSFVVGREASLGLDEKFAPVDAGIVGIVDTINPAGSKYWTSV